MSQKRYLATVSILTGLCASVAYATNGYMPHAIGTASKGMAGAGAAALPQDTLVAFTNPAGLTRVGKRYDVELELFNPKRSYKANDDFDPPPPPSVPPGRFTSDNDYFLIPGLGVNLPIDDKSTVGIALIGQGGMNTEYNNPTFQNFATPPGTPPNPTGAFTAGEPTGVDLAQMTLGVTYARELPGFASLGITRHSIGITPILAVQRFKARGLQPFRALSVSPDKVTNNGYDYSYGGGVRVGWLGSFLDDNMNIGISYQSKLWMTDFDDYEGLFAKGGDFDIPAIFNLGLAFKLTPKLTVAADMRRIFYNDIDALSNPNAVSFNDIQTNPNQRLGGSDGLGFGWSNVNTYSVGVQYQATDKWTLRTGYSNGDEPWRNTNTLFNVLAPATIKNHASVGTTYQLTKQSQINFAYTHAFRNTIQGTSTFTGNQSGYVRMKQNSWQISFASEF